MARFRFKSIRFIDKTDHIELIFQNIYKTRIEAKELEKLGNYKVKDGYIEFKENNNIEKRFNRILEKAFNSLKNMLTGNKTIYVHKNSSIPLYGSLSFGIVDKGSEMIEIKPLTGCNINCIFCSVAEGDDSKKETDFIIEKDYLVEELKRLIAFKDDKVDIYINPHGEPLLYADIIGLVKDIRSIKNVETISIITNSIMLNKNMINDLIKAGLGQINISLNSLEQKKAEELAGCKSIDTKSIIDNIVYMKDKIKVILSPVYMQSINDDDIEQLISFSKNNNIEILIQNFQDNKRGRNPVKELKFKDFLERLKQWESRYKIQLIRRDYKPRKTKQYDMPFKKGDVVDIKAFIPGRYKDEFYGIAQDRLICMKHKKKKAKITKAKNNVFYAG